MRSCVLLRRDGAARCCARKTCRHGSENIYTASSTTATTSRNDDDAIEHGGGVLGWGVGGTRTRTHKRTAHAPKKIRANMRPPAASSARSHSRSYAAVTAPPHGRLSADAGAGARDHNRFIARPVRSCVPSRNTTGPTTVHRQPFSECSQCATENRQKTRA